MDCSYSMLARLQKLTTFALIALALLLAAALLRGGRPVAAVVAAFVVVFAYAFVLALEVLLSRRVNRNEAVPTADALTLLAAWWGEVASAARVFFWSQPFRSRAIADRPGNAEPHGTGIVLVHGFVCNRGLWNPWLRRLDALGVAFIAVDLEPVFGSIDGYTTAIDAAVRRITAATGCPPIVVAHSMGGLAVRAWLAANGAGPRVQHVVTLGTPHHGTALARLAVAANARQMRRDSRWLAALAAGEPRERYRSFTCYYSHCDNIVMPATSATLPGADNRHLYGVAHVRMASDERVWREILQRLRPAPHEAASVAGCE